MMAVNKLKANLYRRNFLARGCGFLASLFLTTSCSDNVTGQVVSNKTPPQSPEPQSPEPASEDQVDVIVVGAGLSGLVAAYE